MENAEKLALERPNSSPNWSQLPSELLHLISKNLTLIFDYISFRSVCSPWRSAARPLDLSPQLPLLVFLFHCGLDDEILQLFSLSDTTKLCRLDLSKPHNKRYVCSAHGWLLVLGIDPSVFLLNPFTSARIQLPPVTTMPGVAGFDPKREGEEYSVVHGGRRCLKNCKEIRDWLVLRLVISSNPSDGDCVLMVALFNYWQGPFRRPGGGDYWKLAFCRPGDESWTEVDCEVGEGFGALAYHDRKFYAIDDTIDGARRVMACDVTVLPPKANVIPSLERTWDVDDQVYFVASGVGLLWIEMHRHGGDEGDTVGGKEVFNVFKMDDAGGKTPRWEMISSLDGEALFLCGDYGMSVKADEFPGIEPDCIYFTNPFHNFGDSNLDVGVFDMKDGSIKMIHYCHPDDGLELGNAGWLRPALY